jgi:hypothetical protein
MFHEKRRVYHGIFWNFTGPKRKMGCAVHFYCFHTYHAKDIKKEKADWTNARKSMFIEIMLELV